LAASLNKPYEAQIKTDSFDLTDLAVFFRACLPEYVDLCA